MLTSYLELSSNLEIKDFNVALTQMLRHNETHYGEMEFHIVQDPFYF